MLKRVSGNVIYRFVTFEIDFVELKCSGKTTAVNLELVPPAGRRLYPFKEHENRQMQKAKKSCLNQR